MGIRVTQAIFLLLSFTFISAQDDERTKAINYCNNNHFAENSETKAAAARCLNDVCSHKCYSTFLGWLNENSEIIEDETKMFENLKSFTRYSETARLYAEGFFKANCNQLLANDRSCAAYGLFYRCAVVSGCRYSLYRAYDVNPSDTIAWNS